VFASVFSHLGSGRGHRARVRCWAWLARWPWPLLRRPAFCGYQLRTWSSQPQCSLAGLPNHVLSTRARGHLRYAAASMRCLATARGLCCALLPLCHGPQPSYHVTDTTVPYRRPMRAALLCVFR
jgi:hypothetical protein